MNMNEIRSARATRLALLCTVAALSAAIGCHGTNDVTDPPPMDDPAPPSAPSSPTSPPSGPKPPTEVCSTFTAAGATYGPFFPAQVAGDREFGGHGPEVWADATVTVDSQGNLYLKSHLKARETKSDWSTAEGSFTTQIGFISYPWKFRRFLTATNSSAYYTDSNHSIDYPAVSGGLIASFAINGDTDGNDIGNTTLDDTYLRVTTKEIRLEACHN